jgi:hypothetical protein
MCHSTSHVPRYVTCTTLHNMCHLRHRWHSTSHVTLYVTCATLRHMCHSTSHVPLYVTCASLRHMCHSTSHVPRYVACASLRHMCHLRHICRSTSHILFSRKQSRDYRDANCVAKSVPLGQREWLAWFRARSELFIARRESTSQLKRQTRRQTWASYWWRHSAIELCASVQERKEKEQPAINGKRWEATIAQKHVWNTEHGCLLYTIMPPYPLVQYSRFTTARKRNLKIKEIKTRFVSFKTRVKRERAVTRWNTAVQMRAKRERAVTRWNTAVQMRARRERAVTRWNTAVQTRPVLDSSSFAPVLTLPRRTCQHSASSVLAVHISYHVIALFVFRKPLFIN